MPPPWDEAYERQRTYESCKTHGLCITCQRLTDRMPGRLECPTCVERKRRINKQAYDRRKAQGTCVRCGSKPARPARVTCQKCADGNIRRRRKRKRRLKDECVCTCGKEIEPHREGSTTCQECADRLKELHDTYAKRGSA